MKISVIMASYNSAATIGTSIASFLEQDHCDKELLVIDGASSDATCDIVRSFESPLISLMSEPDDGIYDGLNKGIERAQGDVIGILHSNDYFCNAGVLSHAAETLEKTGSDSVFADVEFFNLAEPERTVRHYSSARFHAGLLQYGIMPAHPTMFIRRDVFKRFGLYRTDMRIAGDFEFVTRIYKDGDTSFTYAPKVWTRMALGGASTSGIRSRILLNQEILQACRIHSIQSSWLKLLSKYPRKLMEYVPALWKGRA